MIDLEKEREAFQCWAWESVENANLNGEYRSVADTQFIAWKACVESKQSEIDSLKAKLAKYESGEFVMVPKESIGNYYYDECENMYIDDPDSFLSDLWFGDVQEVKRRDYFDLPTQYAANVFTDEDNISWELFDSEEDAEKAAAHCKAMIDVAGGGDE